VTAPPDPSTTATTITPPPAVDDSHETRSPAELFDGIVTSVRSVLFADEGTVVLAVGCLMAGGHLLVEDLPGLGKTTLAKALAHSIGLGFRRVQFTADLLPADITGAMVLDLQNREPTFRHGPVFTNVLMADELNRASPRAQSALLEAMEEHQVTVDGHSVALPHPFLVVATQNPYDAAGTSPLPHGQRDRFLLRISLGYPARPDEDLLLAGADPAARVGHLAAAVTPSELQALMAAVAAVHVAPAARVYVLDLVEATRTHPAVRVGASPRAALSLLRAARAVAVAGGRDYVTPDDVQAVAGPALAHRLLLHAGNEAAGGVSESVVREVLDLVPAPLLERVVPSAGGSGNTTAP
jgi:MoxR-like ATPase